MRSLRAISRVIPTVLPDKGRFPLPPYAVIQLVYSGCSHPMLHYIIALTQRVATRASLRDISIGFSRPLGLYALYRALIIDVYD